MRIITHILFFISSLFLYQNLTAQQCDSINTVVVYDFDRCNSIIGSENLDYSEFISETTQVNNCATVSSSIISRSNPTQNPHSCIEGKEGLAMCIIPLDECVYDSLSDKALRFSVVLDPATDGIVQWTNLEFYQQAPRVFKWIDGASGYNNYPTKLAIRISVEGNEIFRSIKNTTASWNKENFDLSVISEFAVFESTEFDVEILPYCLVGNSYSTSVWDIDELKINTCCISCPDLSPGSISPLDDPNLCLNDDNSAIVDFELSAFNGPNSAWAITNTSGTILNFPVEPPLDFSEALPGRCRVYHLVYDASLTKISIGDNINTINGCAVLSNSVEIIRSETNGGEINSPDANNEVIYACNGDGNQALVDFSLINQAGQNSAWLITNLVGTIYEIRQSVPIDFEGTNYNACNIYHIGYQNGLVGLEENASIHDLEGCFDLSNKLTVLRSGVDGGTITINGKTELCILSEDIRNVNIDVVGEVGQRDAWFITDLNGEILRMPIFPPFDLSGLSDGQYQVWHAGHTAQFEGDEIGNNISDLTGCFDLSRPITFDKTPLNGGDISTNSNTNICSGDGVADIVNIVSNSVIGTNSTLLVTNELGEIIGLPSGNSIDFEGADAGVCYVYNIAYESGIENLSLGSFIDLLDGCFELSNAIRIDRSEVSGGTISTLDPVNICVGDGQSDLISFEIENNIGDSFKWLITDDNGFILDIPASLPIDFENAEGGVCVVYNLSYLDNIAGLIKGDNISGLEGCYELSNPIVITHTEVSGGVISSQDNLDLCVGDGNGDEINVQLEDNIGTNNRWIITDETGLILELPQSQPFNFESATAGVCLIWNVSFEGVLVGLAVGENASDLSGCFDLSNSLRVIRNQVSGGIISTQDPTTICAGDGMNDLVNVNLSNNAGSRDKWVVTDDAGVILEIQNSSVFNFENANSGVCRIYHLSHNGELIGLLTGGQIDNIEGCYDLSNFIEITRDQVDGGNITSDDPIDLCVITGQSAFFTAEVNNNIGSNSSWLQTDLNGNIISTNSNGMFDLALTGSGTSVIWHLSFENGLSGNMVGNNAEDLSGCFSLSNPIEVDPTFINGGQLTPIGPLSVCISNGESDLVELELETVAGTKSDYIIHDDNDDILKVQDDPSFDFSGAGTGICYIRHISYESGLFGLLKGRNLSELSGCFDLSNRVEINRSNLVGGVISTDDALDVCVGEGIDDLINPEVVGSEGENSNWVITDQDLNILESNASAPLSFETAGEGICLIWNISYKSGLDGLINGRNLSDLDGCFALSNALVVNRTEVNGGVISTNNSTRICSGNGELDEVNVTLNSAIGANSTWLVTDIDGLILDRTGTPTFNFEGAPSGTCLIYHLSYESGTRGIGIGDNLNNATGCFDLSNSIEIIRNEVDGGEVSYTGDLDVCSGDGVNDILGLSVTNNLGSNSSWVITDEDQNILERILGTTVNFEGAGEGVCLIYHVGYEGIIQGLNVDDNLSDLRGCFDLSEPIRVVRSEVNGGTIQTNDDTDICSGDGVDDIIEVELNSAVGANSVWLITDASGIILDQSNTPIFNFEGAPTGECLIWHLSYEDGIIGLENNLSANNLQGCFSLSNAISVNRNEVEGGTISTNSPTTICVGDGLPDIINVDLAGNVGESFTYVITDNDGLILDFPSGNSFDFDGANTGICLIWNLSANGILSGLDLGRNISEVSGCFDLSNAIEVVRTEVSAGQIELENGATSTSICIDDCVIDSIYVNLTNNVGENGDYIITSPSGEILAFPAFQPFTFESAGIGTCLIWHMSYEDGLTGAIVGNNVSELQGCFAISNSISVDRRAVEGSGASSLFFDMNECDARQFGEFDEDYSEFTAIVDNVDDCAQLEVINSNLYRLNNTERIHSCTDGVNGTEAICVSSLNQCTFQNDSDYAIRIDIGIVPGISGTGVFSGMDFYERAPIDFNFTNGDQGLNNFPTLYGVRILKNGNEVFRSDNNPTANDYSLQSFDFSELDSFKVSEPTIFQIELLGYCLAGVDSEETAWDIDDLKIYSDCYNKIDAGSLTLQNQSTRIEYCTDNGIPDIAEFFTTSDFASYQYVVTDTLNRILAIPNGATFDFEGGLAGICQVWGIAYTGTFNANIGETVGVDDMSTGCFDISANFLRITRVNGGDCPQSITIPDNPTSFSLAPNPALEIIQLDLTNLQSDDLVIKVLNMHGEQMLIVRHDSTMEPSLDLQISDFLPGNYMISILDKNRAHIQRFVKI